MPQRTLRFRIRQDGIVEETVEGVEGKLCHQLTESLEEALGVVQQRKSTSEAFLESQKDLQPNSAEIH